jgi:hypothetical protein
VTAVFPAASEDVLELDSRSREKLEAGRVLSAIQSSPPGVEVKALARCSPNHMLELLSNYPAMPEHIFGLERAEVLRYSGATSTVRFTMNLPFPVGRVVWTNLIQARSIGGIHSLEWTLLDGDLEINDGRLVMTAYQGNSNVTYANYRVRVKSRSAFPKIAERLATRWLLPRVVGKLLRVAEER